MGTDFVCDDSWLEEDYENRNGCAVDYCDGYEEEAEEEEFEDEEAETCPACGCALVDGECYYPGCDLYDDSRAYSDMVSDLRCGG